MSEPEQSLKQIKSTACIAYQLRGKMAASAEARKLPAPRPSGSDDPQCQ